MYKNYKIYKFKKGFLSNSYSKQSGGNLVSSANIEGVMNKIYDNLSNSYVVTQQQPDEKNLVRSTYGEMKFPSVSHMISQLNINKDDVFYDLGSGSGKVVMQVFLEAGVKKSIGVEYFNERHTNAKTALDKMYQLYPELKNTDRQIIYNLGNIKDVNLDDATVIFMCSTCYPSELLTIVLDKIKNSKNIRAVVTHKMHDDFMSVLPNKSTITFSCTWSENLTWYVYRK